MTRYYSLNRVGRPVNNLDLVNRNNTVNQFNVYATMGHRGGNVRIIAPPDQDQEMFNVRGESQGSGDNYEATYNVSSVQHQ